MSRFDKLSIFPKEDLILSPNVSIAILVITRWNDKESRMVLRNIILDSLQKEPYPKIKLFFVFGISKSATNERRGQIENEQEEYKDMIIPGEFYL